MRYFLSWLEMACNIKKKKKKFSIQEDYNTGDFSAKLHKKDLTIGTCFCTFHLQRWKNYRKSLLREDFINFFNFFFW